jgi:chemotaxis protein CheZ
MTVNTTAANAHAKIDPAAILAADRDADPFDVFQRIGSITRRLHDALRELGYDKALESAVGSLPDARDRLAYIAKLTGDSANKVLNTVEFAQAAQDEMALASDALKVRWTGKQALSAADAADAALITDTTDFLSRVSDSTKLTNNHLTDIMMAQDFHDLTGQVIRKVVDLAQTLEEQLLALLLETTPPEQRAKLLTAETGGLSGPVICAEGRADVVTNQSQVDDMLESLGF